MPALIGVFGLFCKGVMRLHQLLQALVEHMRIDLCRRNVAVAEQFLHRAKVCAIAQEVARKGVAQHMRRDGIGRKSGADREVLQLPGKDLPGQMPLLAVGRNKKGLSACAGSAARIWP